MKLCIIAHFAFGSLSGGAKGHVGGVERQTSLMAKWFAAKGHSVTVLTWDEGQQADCLIDGVRVIKMCKRYEGIPGLRFFYPRWTSLNSALKKADADIYYQNCGEYVTGQVALWCQRHRKHFIFSSASDTDCDPDLPALRKIRERILYKYGLFNANAIIAQTKKQQRLLQKGFNLSSTVLPMPCPGPDIECYQQPVLPTGKSAVHVGWAARISPEKRLELLIETAKSLPEVIFEIAGAATDEDGKSYASPILDAASLLPNVILHGRISRENMASFYRSLHLFCCTSKYEGFPNTFLEAWSHGLPIVSTFDPDDLIVNRNLGRKAHDSKSMVGAICRYINDKKEWNAVSSRCRQYYLQNYTVDEVMGKFERIFMEMIINDQEMQSLK